MTNTYLVADLFRGAGGSSTGAKKAIAEIGGTMDLLAINHWNTAIATHAANHPTARHLVEDVSIVDPEAVVEEGRLDLRFRMLQNPELARAMGFEDEETQYEFVGNVTEVTKQIGNAVPVNMAAALVKAALGRETKP